MSDGEKPAPVGPASKPDAEPVGSGSLTTSELSVPFVNNHEGACNTSDAHVGGGDDDKGKSALQPLNPEEGNGHGNDTHGAPDAGARSLRGDERDGALGHIVGGAGDEPVRADDVIERFTRETQLRFRTGSGTPRVYAQVFRRFAKMESFETYTRQAIAGKKGRLLLLDFMARVPEKSRRVNIAALKCVWVCGLGLPFPLDVKRDFGKALPTVGRRKTPADVTVRPWVEAAAREKDTYTKAFILCELQFGWRPANQIGHLRWHHLRYDGGRMHHVEADGTEARFKSPAPIVACLPDDVRKALEAWRVASPAAGEDDYIFPWRGYVVSDHKQRFEVHPKEPQTEATIWRLWNAFRRKHDLPELRPVDLRHFVKTALRRLGLSDPAAAAWQGHKATEGGMRAVYDNPENEALLDEQATVVPRGPTAVLMVPEVRDEAALPPEYLRIVMDHMAGKISDIEAAAALGKARIRLAAKDAASIVEP